MTFEEQLAALAEADARIARRHEALTHAVEILAGMQKESERQRQENERHYREVAHNFEIVLDSLKRLERIAAAHEQRLDDLEDR